MTNQAELLEPSFAQAMASIESADGLSQEHKRHWICSLRQIGKWLNRPLAMIPARWTSIRMPVGQLHHARVGVAAKTLANHKSNVAAALRWCRGGIALVRQRIPSPQPRCAAVERMGSTA
jgi:hypothetical protein